MTFAATPAELDRWNGRYAADGYLFGRAPNRFLASQASRLVDGQRALCVSDGDGRNSVWLATRGLRVTAFDLSPVGVDKARRLAQEAGVAVDYHVSDVYRWKWEAAAYDVVAAIFIQFANPEQRAEIFAGIIRTLRAGGLLMLQGYTPRQLEYRTGGPSQVENLYTEPLLREAFAELDILHLATHDERVEEGTAHVGMSALIDLVARKPVG